jgi:diacylglycerol kinase family enzyme
LAGRVSAIAALVLLAVVFLALVVFLVTNLGSFVLGLAGVAVAVAGGWWLLTERMPRRAVGIVEIAVGLGVIAVAFAGAVDGPHAIGLRAVLVAVLLGAALACARAAMAHEIGEVEVHVRAGGAPRRPLLLCNLRSGGNRVERFGLIELASQLGVETKVLEPDHDLEQLAREAVTRGCDCLGMAGGDGSQAVVAAIAVEHGLPFVCIPAGTRNHLALDLGLDRDDPRPAMYAFRDAVERRVDFATVNGRMFLNNVSLGVYAQIVQEESYRDAKLRTTTTVLPEILGRQAEPFDLQFTTPRGEAIDGAILVQVSNNPYVVGATPDNAQRRRLDSGRLGVFAVTTRTGAAAAQLLTASVVGLRRHSRYWHEFNTSTFELRSGSGVVLAGIDGEAVTIATPLTFELHPLGLTLLVPADNAKSAARRMGRDVRISELVALAVGRERVSTA